MPKTLERRRPWSFSHAFTWISGAMVFCFSSSSSSSASAIIIHYTPFVDVSYPFPLFSAAGSPGSFAEGAKSFGFWLNLLCGGISPMMRFALSLSLSSRGIRCPSIRTKAARCSCDCFDYSGCCFRSNPAVRPASARLPPDWQPKCSQ